MYKVLKIEKDTKAKTVESLRTMLPYVIDTAVLTILYRDAFINADTINVTGNATSPYIASLIQLYGITYSYQFLKTYLENEKNNYSKTLYK